MRFCGIHPFGHDSSIVLLDTLNQTIEVFTLERYTRKKHDMNFVLPLFLEKITNFKPQICSISQLEGRLEDILMFERLQKIYEIKIQLRKKKSIFLNKIRLYFHLSILRKHIFVRKKQTFQQFKSFIQSKLAVENVDAYDHHMCHAYSALYTASFYKEEKILIVSIDGQGDSACATLSTSDNLVVKRQITINNDFSLCLLYSYFTEVAGFNPNADEGKLEALACYYNFKTSSLLNHFNEWIRIDPNTLEFHVFKSNEIPFSSICNERRKIINWLIMKYSGVSPEEFSFVMQSLFENKYLEWIQLAKEKFGSKLLCLAGGGVANVKLNLRIFEEANFEKIHIIPAMGDDGVAFGAAIISAAKCSAELDFLSKTNMPFFGYQCTESEIEIAIALCKSKNLEVLGPFVDDELAGKVADELANNKICAVFRGKAEFGPRALGHRSILANPIDQEVRNEINNKFKKREAFQPFCPIILDTDANKVLNRYYSNKHMTCAFRVNEGIRALIPSVVHVDNTARAQILEREDDPFIYSLIEKFKVKTKIGVILNTSFNLHGRAMVNNPNDAIDDFLDCGLDFLVLENYLIRRKKC